jgi:2-keto-4-pentenoate hydratase/2-oxohepta-3-ene-1,7-dioic acid hydratase in catechol pathway
MIFPKLQASLAGPFDAIPVSTAAVDWEVELVVIVGRRARHVPAAKAWDHVAGLTIGQDLSEREIQFRPPRRLSSASASRCRASGRSGRRSSRRTTSMTATTSS